MYLQLLQMSNYKNYLETVTLTNVFNQTLTIIFTYRVYLQKKLFSRELFFCYLHNVTPKFQNITEIKVFLMKVKNLYFKCFFLAAYIFESKLTPIFQNKILSNWYLQSMQVYSIWYITTFVGTVWFCNCNVKLR